MRLLRKRSNGLIRQKVEMALSLRGSFVAIVTPFDHKGRIDTKALEHFVDWQIEEGTQGIVCAGTTGEAITLSEKERERVLSIVLSIAQKRALVIVGSGTADTRQSVRLTEKMQKLGADGCLIQTPYYNKPTPRGSILHFQEIAKVGLPVIAYNNPARTTKLDLETVREIGKIPGVVGYKDSTGDLDFIKALHSISPIPIFSGDDHLTLATIEEGGVGAISVIGNLFPNSWRKMIDFALEKKWKEAQEIVDRLFPILQVLFLETNPQCVKLALHLLGKCRETLRLPLVVPTKENQEKIASALKNSSIQSLLEGIESKTQGI